MKNVFGREFVGRVGRGVAAIEEAIAGPDDVGSFDPLQSVGENLAGSDFHNVDFLPIGPSGRNAIGDVTCRSWKCRKYRGARVPSSENLLGSRSISGAASKLF